MLYDSGEHRPLLGEEWSERRARAAVERIAQDAIDAYRGPDLLWPNAPEDLEGEPDRPFRNAYFGAAGTAWALNDLARRQLAPAFEEAPELARQLHAGFLQAPELTNLEPPPAPSLLFGESGILLAAEAIVRDESSLAALEETIRRNVAHPSLELCWGSPGTMTAALSLWETTGEERWRRLWLASADHLIDEWRELVWVQDLYGSRTRYVGAGHGFAGAAFALLSGGELLGQRFEAIAERVRRVLIELAHVEGQVAQWFPHVDLDVGRHPVQWCHGAPGIVTSLATLPPDQQTDRLLRAGGELTWRCGPLSKGPGICHGTAGNAYAFLALLARTGDEVWLQRARAFAMDAITDVERRRVKRGHGRHSLYTGDLGVAMLVSACLDGDHRFPLLEGALARRASSDPE